MVFLYAEYWLQWYLNIVWSAWNWVASDCYFGNRWWNPPFYRLTQTKGLWDIPDYLFWYKGYKAFWKTWLWILNINDGRWYSMSHGFS